MTEKWRKKFRIEFEKDPNNSFIISIALKFGQHIFATIREWDLIEDETIPQITEWIRSKTYAVVSTEDENLERVLFNTTYVWTRKRDIRNAFWMKPKEDISKYTKISINDQKLLPLIWQLGINATNNFISKYWEKAFLKIMKELLI